MAKRNLSEDRFSEISLQPVEISVDLPGKNKAVKPGLKINRYFTKPGEDVYGTVGWEKRDSVISDEKGTIISHIAEIEVPSSWSQLATDVLAYKYLRKAGVPTKEGRETGAKQAIYRIAHSISDFGEKFGYFSTKEDRANFEDELTHLLLFQKAAFNSPVWFNCGLYQVYGIKGREGSFYWDFEKKAVLPAEHGYRNPQCSACFILSVQDTLPGIFELVKTEAHIFKYGSGAGANFARLRSRFERLSNGGTSSGMMNFLTVFDRAAGATKSGGTTRRAAKMVVVDISHPEIEEFIDWKVKEEKKAAALIAAGYETDFNGEAYSTVSGQNANNSVRVTDEFMEALQSDGEWQTRLVTTGEAHKTYKARELMNQIAEAAWQCADPGLQFDTTINDWHTCPNTDRIYASNPCVTGDTLIATEHGYRRIDSLVGRKPLVVGSDGRLHQSVKIWKTGRKPIYELRTVSGYRLRLTAEHRVSTVDHGDIAARNLQPGDVIQLFPGRFGTQSLRQKVAELIGLAIGDGCLAKGANNQEFFFLTPGHSEYAVAHAAQSAISQIQSKALLNGEIDRRSARPTCVREVPSGWRVGTSSCSVLNLLKQYAILDRAASGKRLTDKVFQLDQASIAGILRGLFTSDGTVANYGHKSHFISLDMSSLELLEQVQILLLNFGIKSKIYRNRRPSEQLTSLLPNGRGGYTDYPVKQYHSLRISKNSRFVFENLINFCPSSPKRVKLAKLNRHVGVYSDPLNDRLATLTLVGEEDVYDLTEPITNHFVANGLVVHNCSEYMFLDDSACNLASINLAKFIDDKGKIDIEGFRRACRVILIAQEIEVDFSSYPTARVTQNSHDYRPLGLGFANLGTLLMLKGVPYDSPQALAIAGALAAIMTGHAYKTSAEMAAVKGQFNGFAKNRAPMLEVMRKHRTAAYRIEEKSCPSDLLEAARQDWDEAVALGEQFGYRNAQTTVIAPTGTIGLLMDCDTTGVEPDFALVKFKKLAGRGSIKIVNQAVRQALANLGYPPSQQDEIVRYALGTVSLEGDTPINRQSLLTKGFDLSEIEAIVRALPSAFELDHVFNRGVLGGRIFDRLGIGEEEEASPGFSLLKRLGFSGREIEVGNEAICGTQMLENAPHLKPEHYAVFDCANRCGPRGKRYLSPISHVRMMAAVQPFISGAISKTVNLPNEATAKDIEEVYLQSWKLGLKALAVYRDGSKLSQPLVSKRQEESESKDEEEIKTTMPLPRRRRLPDERQAITHKFQIAGYKGYLTVGLFEEGTPGEIFITMAKQGSVISGLMDAFATSVSIALQYGVPLSVLIRKFSNSRFEPSGLTSNPQIRLAKSIVDYIARYLGLKFLGPEEQEILGIKPNTLVATNQAKLDLAIPIEPAKEEPINTLEPGETETDDRQVRQSVLSDAPPCPNCGSMTVKTGTCYTCLSCGSTTGGCS